MATHRVFTAVETAGHSRAAMMRAARRFTRDELLKALAWNDSNGVYLDEDVKSENLPVLTKDEAVDYVVDIAQESLGYDLPPHRRNPSGGEPGLGALLVVIVAVVVVASVSTRS